MKNFDTCAALTTLKLQTYKQTQRQTHKQTQRQRNRHENRSTNKTQQKYRCLNSHTQWQIKSLQSAAKKLAKKIIPFSDKKVRKYCFWYPKHNKGQYHPTAIQQNYVMKEKIHLSRKLKQLDITQQCPISLKDLKVSLSQCTTS